MSLIVPRPISTHPATPIHDGLKIEEVPELLRALYTEHSRNLAAVQQLILAHPGWRDERTAKFLRAMDNNVSLERAKQGLTGDVLTLIAPGYADWTSVNNPGVGGVVPAGLVHVLLDGTYNSDTLAGAVVLGDLIAGNATPKWARVPGQITTTRKFLRQTGTGTVSAVPAWDTLTAADVATGWQDVANLISEIVTTDKVVIGAAAAILATRFSVVNAGATTDNVVTIKGAASQTGRLLRFQNSASREQAYVDALGRLCLGSANPLDSAIPAGVFFFDAATGSAVAQNLIATVNWGTGAVGPPVATTDIWGCQGARIYTYKDNSGQFDNGYGQDAVDAWVLVSNDGVTYSIYTGIDTGHTPFLRAQWAGNGDLTNYGKVLVKKSGIVAGGGSVAAGVPGIELEQTGAGTNAIKLRAPATVAAGRTQLLLDMNATIPVVGDKSGTVGSRQMGKVDLTAQAAAITSTNLTNSAIAGMYLVSYTIADTTADAASLATVQFQVNHTDDAGATNQPGATVAVAALGRDKGTFTVQLASGELSYQVNVVGTIGATAKFSLHVRVLFLG